MHFLHLTLLYCMLNFPALKYPPSSPAKILKSGATNIIYQSKDGGLTWQDISYGLPENEQPEDFFAGESGLYLRVKNELYHSKSNLKAPVWEKENVLDPRGANNKDPNSKTHSMRTIVETSDSVFLGSDKGESLKQVQNQGWVTDMVESEGVLIGIGQKGIRRSTDNGEHWDWVISEGGVGIAVERIDGGFAVISYNATTQSRRIRISLDRGKSWHAIDEGLRPSLSISSIKQMGKYLICGHPDGIFRSSDMGKTWDFVHPSVDSAFKISGQSWNIASGDNGKVFKIYVSGNVLYAVARNAGC